MNTKVILTAAALVTAAAPAFAQQAEVAVTATDEAAVVVTGTETGFVPLAGAALGAAGPLALGLGAIILIGALGGGGNSSGTNGTN